MAERAGHQKEPVKVLDLFCGTGQALLPIAERLSDRPVHYVGIDREPRHLGYPNLPASVGDIRVHAAKLDLQRPDALQAALHSLVGDSRFDEIHLHMPTGVFAKPNLEAERALKVLGGFLRRGGRLYHLFQQTSPLLSFEPEQWDADAPQGEPPKIWAHNRYRAGKLAERAGFSLEKYGLNQFGASQPEEFRKVDRWITSPATYRRALQLDRVDRTEFGPRKAAHEKMADLVNAYTKHGRFVNHFLILKKK